MEHDIFASLKRLADQELVSRMKALIARERDATAELVAHLAELDTREVHLREGYPSLYAYCRDVLRLSEWEAYNRIEVARSARRFPMILGLLADGSVHLTAVRLLAPHLTPENHRHLLESARGRTKAEVQHIVATLAPQPDVPFSIRKVSAAANGLPIAVPQPISAEPLSPGPARPAPTGAPAPHLLPAPAPVTHSRWIATSSR